MATSNTGKFGGKALTDELRKLAAQAVTIDDGGESITREALLARLIWDQALGYEEKIRDEHGNLKVIKHDPKSWAQTFLFERIVGKAAPAVADESDGIKASERVRELSKKRLNALASSALGPPKRKTE